MENKKKILILGNKGMLGHVVQRYFENKKDYEVIGLNRTHLDMSDTGSLENAIFDHKPDYIINCVGILNNSNNYHLYAEMNVVLPKMLQKLSTVLNFKLIHISTNCVFDGLGPHDETEIPDAKDVYGISKALGEINDEHNLTIRCSITGPELKKEGTGMMNQFIHNPDFIKGYATTMWNGISTLELADFISKIMKHETGLIHYYTKFEDNKLSILDTINDVFEVGKTLELVYNTKAHHGLLKGKYSTDKIYDIQFIELKEFMIENKDLYEGIYEDL